MTEVYEFIEAKVLLVLLGIGVVWSVITIFMAIAIRASSTELVLDILCLPINLGLLFTVKYLSERLTNQHVEARKKEK